MTFAVIKSQVQESVDTKNAILNNDNLIEQVATLAQRCASALRSGGKIIFCGNGGSFADAQHLSAEFTSRFLFNRPGLPSLALGTNSSAMSAIGNDYGYENVFSREIEAIANSKDILIAMTTSGNSLNIIKVLDAAKKNSVYSIVFTGQRRGKLDFDTEMLNIPSSDTARIQECHMLIGHIICGLVEAEIFKQKNNSEEN